MVACMSTETRRYTCAPSVSPWDSAIKTITSDSTIHLWVRTIRQNKFLFSFLYVCVFSCVGRYRCTCRCDWSAHVGICIWGSLFDNKYLFKLLPTCMYACVYWDRFSHWTWDFLLHLDWLASHSQGSFHLCHSSSGIIDAWCFSQVLKTCVLEIPIQVLVPVQKILYWLRQLTSSKLLFIAHSDIVISQNNMVVQKCINHTHSPFFLYFVYSCWSEVHLDREKRDRLY